MEDNEKKVIQMSLSKFIILIILLIVVLGLGIGLYIGAVVKQSGKADVKITTESEKGMEETQKEENNIRIEGFNSNETNTILNGSETIGVRYNKEFEDMLVDYIMDSIEEYAKNGSIIKSNTGDVTAEQLTVEEVNRNSKNYKEKITEMIKNEEIFGNVYKVDNKDACKYNLEKILNNLGLGTHMGQGTGQVDESGNKVYVYGKTEIDVTTPSSGN